MLSGFNLLTAPFTLQGASTNNPITHAGCVTITHCHCLPREHPVSIVPFTARFCLYLMDSMHRLCELLLCFTTANSHTLGMSLMLAGWKLPSHACSSLWTNFTLSFFKNLSYYSLIKLTQIFLKICKLQDTNKKKSTCTGKWHYICQIL